MQELCSSTQLCRLACGLSSRTHMESHDLQYHFLMLSSLQCSAQSRTRWVVSSGCDACGVVSACACRARILGQSVRRVLCAMRDGTKRRRHDGRSMQGTCATASFVRSFVLCKASQGSMHIHVPPTLAAKNVVYVCGARLPLTAGHVLVTGWPRACVRSDCSSNSYVCSCT